MSYSDGLLGEQLRDLPHGQEEAQRRLLERLEAEMPIEALDPRVLRIHDHRHGRDLLCGFEAAAQRVHECVSQTPNSHAGKTRNQKREKNADRSTGYKQGMAERVGFEPTWGASPQQISSLRRYDRFGTSPERRQILLGVAKKG